MKWEYLQPVTIRFGEGIIKELKDVVASIGCKKGILVSDPFFYKMDWLKELYGKVKELLFMYMEKFLQSRGKRSGSCRHNSQKSDRICGCVRWRKRTGLCKGCSIGMLYRRIYPRISWNRKSTFKGASSIDCNSHNRWNRK